MPDIAASADTTRQVAPGNRPIAMIDLAAQRARIGKKVDAAIARVLDHGRFILGPEVEAFERQLAARCGIGHAIGCGSGTEALVLSLMALGVGPGDAVLVPSFTFTATAEAVVLVGATPVFVDVEPDTFNMSAASLASGIAAGRAAGLKAVIAIPVDLFGQPADYAGLTAVAAREGVTLLADAAQRLGAAAGNKHVGALAPITATSFYPSKPLGCYGDGGAVLTDDTRLAERLRQIRSHGQRHARDDVVCLGTTSRLDSIQAAVLLEKLAVFEDECRARQEIADRYASLLAGSVAVPRLKPGNTSVWAQYTVLSPGRDRIVAVLRDDSIATSVFYPRPVHTQAPYRNCPIAATGLPVTERLAREAVSLPMHPYLTADDLSRVAGAIRRAVA